MDVFQLIVSFFVGGQIVFLMVLKYILDSRAVSLDFVTVQLQVAKAELEAKCKEFEVIMQKVATANNSLGEKAATYDEKIAQIENKLNMMNLKFNGR